MYFICLDCDHEFNESEAEIVSFGTGAVLSKVEYFACPICNATELKDKETNRIQNQF